MSLCTQKSSVHSCFGLFSKSPNRIVGVVIYGSHANHCLCESLCGWDERYNIYELTRLYVDDGLPKNLESFLVGNTLKLLDKEIIVSYSDTEFNHVGIIYQATNFYYTGLSSGGNKDFEEIDENGNRLHNKSLMEKYGSVDGIRKAMKNGANIYISKNEAQNIDMCILIVTRNARKSCLQNLNIQFYPYPKATNPVPITSTENINDNKKKSLF